MSELENYYAAAEHALANFLGTDDLDQDMIELVADLCYQSVMADRAGQYRYAQDLLEKSSTYVQADLDELEMQDYVGELEEQLEAYGVL